MALDNGGDLEPGGAMWESVGIEARAVKLIDFDTCLECPTWHMCREFRWENPLFWHLVLGFALEAIQHVAGEPMEQRLQALSSKASPNESHTHSDLEVNRLNFESVRGCSCFEPGTSPSPRGQSTLSARWASGLDRPSRGFAPCASAS